MKNCKSGKRQDQTKYTPRTARCSEHVDVRRGKPNGLTLLVRAGAAHVLGAGSDPLMNTALDGKRD